MNRDTDIPEFSMGWGGEVASGVGACRVGAMGKLSSIESEFETSEAAEEHDRWFRAKVAGALASTEPAVPHDEVVAEADGHRREAPCRRSFGALKFAPT
ncbi:MAG TPA: hypothetical protein VMG08_02145 [Allosphingosinicella sp.]|nr:hypothetical protein [Allosphingosinicella sp.]